MGNLVPHLPFDRLIALVEGRIDVAERAQLISHLDRCRRCRTEVAQLARLIGLMRSDATVDPPPAVVTRAVRLFRPTPAAPSSLWQRLVAVLHFDSAQRALAFGVRTATDAEIPSARQFLYSAGEHELDLRVTPAGERWIVAGQVLSSIAGGQVELQSPNRVLYATLNAVSEFTLPPTPPGYYTLIVHLADRDVEVNELTVGV